MKKFSLLFIAVSISILLLNGCVTKELTHEEKEIIAKAQAQLPFPVKVDGNSAVTNSTIAALIEDSVSSDSEILCEVANDDIINITFFPCDNEGIVVPGKKPALIIIRESNKSSLDKTIDGKKLTPGFYLMDVSQGNRTSRIVIEVE
jgi:hypothetical protein